MKKIILFLLVFISLEVFSQTYPPPGFTHQNSKLEYVGVFPKSYLGVYPDTFVVISALRPYNWIATKNNSLYVWNTIKLKWEASVGINNIFNSSVTNVTLINGDSCAIVGKDTLCFGFAICDYGFINDTLFAACPCADTLNPVPVCDTLPVSSQSIFFLQNGIRWAANGIGEAYDNYDGVDNGRRGRAQLLHNSTLDIRYNQLHTFQTTVYDYGIQNHKYPNFGFESGTGIESWLHENNSNQPNIVRLGINYTGAVYQPGLSNFTGYFGARSGYFVGVNLTGQGSGGFHVDNSHAPASGIFINTDSASGEGLSLYSVPPIIPGNLGNVVTPATVYPYIGLTMMSNKNLKLQGYPTTRNDGAISSGVTKIMYMKSDSTIGIGTFTAGGFTTADNGLTASTATNVQLGGTLLQNTNIATAGFTTTWNGAGVGGTGIVNVANTNSDGACIWADGHLSTQFAIYGVGQNIGILGEGGTGIYGNGFIGVEGVSPSAGIGLYGLSTATNGVALVGQNEASSTNTVIGVAEIRRTTSGTTGNGIGGSIIFKNKLTTAAIENSISSSNLLESKWTDVTDATRTSQFIITGVSNAATDNLLAMGDYVNLTESSATTFTSTTIPTGKIGGGEITVTIAADDATDFQARTLRFIWSAVNKAGTTTVTISIPEEVVSTSTGTLTATITAVDGGSGVVNFQANAVSSLTQTTLRCSYQISKNF